MLAVVLILAAALLLLLAILWRLSANAGPLDLEDYARRNHVVFIPVSGPLADELGKGWSKPLRMRLDRGRHPLLAELICTSQLDDDQTAP